MVISTAGLAHEEPLLAHPDKTRNDSTHRGDLIGCRLSVEATRVAHRQDKCDVSSVREVATSPMERRCKRLSRSTWDPMTVSFRAGMDVPGGWSPPPLSSDT